MATACLSYFYQWILNKFSLAIKRNGWYFSLMKYGLLESDSFPSPIVQYKTSKKSILITIYTNQHLDRNSEALKLEHVSTGLFCLMVCPKKMTKCQITCKALKKSSTFHNFLRVWHVRADQSKKHPVSTECSFLTGPPLKMSLDWPPYIFLVLESYSLRQTPSRFSITGGPVWNVSLKSVFYRPTLSNTVSLNRQKMGTAQTKTSC